MIRVPHFSLLIILVGLLTGGLFLGPVYADTGGPGVGGRYVWTDSNAPPPQETYYWREIAGPEGGSGTEIERSQWSGDPDDGCFNIQTIGFDFRFYGYTYSDVYVCTNGFLNFGTCIPEYINDPIPDIFPPNNFIGAFWDDLDLTNYGGATVYYEVQGSAPLRELIVEWYKIPHIRDSASRLTFQAILFEGSNDILCQYNTMTDSFGDWASGTSATLGIEGPLGFQGLQYSYNQPFVVSDGLAIRYRLFEDNKWSQLPNVIDGFDTVSSQYIPAYTDIVVADDWCCENGKPIHKISWFGSYLDWMEDTDAEVPPPPVEPAYFRISWYEYDHPGTFSQPGNLIRQEDWGCYTQGYFVAVQWWDQTGVYEHEWGYEQELLTPWEQEMGYYYFLSIQAIYDQEPYYYWGWKNSEEHWNDDAVISVDGGLSWVELTWPSGHRLEGQSMDMAFDLYYSLLPTPTPYHLVLESGDYNGDGTSEVVIFRPTTGLWVMRDLSRLYFGAGGDIPASGDYDGDGITDVAIFRSATGLWVIRALTRLYYGTASDASVPSDYDGDGRADVAVFRQNTGLWSIRGLTRVYFGTSGDIPVPGDWDGDGFSEVAIFRPASALWVMRGVSRFYFGSGGDIPVPADYDMDGVMDYAIFRSPTGLWAGVRSSAGPKRIYWGTPGDIPVPANYDGDSWTEPAIFRPTTGLWAISHWQFMQKTRFYFGTAGDRPVSR